MRRFASFAQLRDYAERSNDRELITRCKIVETYRDRIPELIERIRQTRDPAAEVTITTAHRAKGLEFDNVILGDDFPALMIDGVLPAVRGLVDDEDVLPEEEANLWYVATTRARKSLVLNQMLHDFVLWRIEQRDAQ